MFNLAPFRTTPELDFVRGPLLTSYLRFEILLWGVIALLSLLAWLSATFLPAPGPEPVNAEVTLLLLFAFCAAVIVMFIAVWRFKKWGVIALALWTLLLIVGAVVTLFAPQKDWLFLVALIGWIMARGLVLLFEIRPKWSYFTGGLW